MKGIALFIGMCSFLHLFAQPVLEKNGRFPNYVLRPVINAPSPEVDVQKLKGKYIILNFWGTWCSSCIPEMDSLAVLQKMYQSQIQIIGVSDDPIEKLKAYLRKRPTPVWLASDPGLNLYRQAGFSYVGQSIILDPLKKIIGLVRTDSINRKFIAKMLRGDSIVSSAEVFNAPGKNEEDAFGVDSTIETAVSIRGYMKNKPSMSSSYKGGSLEGRRLTYYNVCPVVLFKEAYGIQSPAQVQFEVDRSQVCNYSDKSTLVCFDILVKPSQRDSVKWIMRQKLNQLLPWKARIESKTIAVYILTRDTAAQPLQPSAGAKADYSFSGSGFSGTAIPIGIFADYLSNELQLPVVDETGLKEKYDIETALTLRTTEEVINSLKRLGLKIQKTERELPVLIISKNSF